jgi:hypothetical protein
LFIARGWRTTKIFVGTRKDVLRRVNGGTEDRAPKDSFGSGGLGAKISVFFFDKP